MSARVLATFCDVPRLRVQLEFKLADLWVGAYVHSADVRPYAGVMTATPEERARTRRWVDAWLCVVPCLPLHISWRPR